jgi:hypothetical protein
VIAVAALIPGDSARRTQGRGPDRGRIHCTLGFFFNAANRIRPMHLSGPRRLAIFATALWIGVTFVGYAFERWEAFMIVGLLPPGTLWGCWWVWRGFAQR